MSRAPRRTLSDPDVVLGISSIDLARLLVQRRGRESWAYTGAQTIASVYLYATALRAPERCTLQALAQWADRPGCEIADDLRRIAADESLPATVRSAARSHAAAAPKIADAIATTLSVALWRVYAEASRVPRGARAQALVENTARLIADMHRAAAAMRAAHATEAP